MTSLQKDAQIIAALGGPSKVVELLQLPKKGGQQRVQNWIARGIPARVKVERPDLFMPELAETKPKQPPTPAHKTLAAINSDIEQGAAHAQESAHV